MAVPLFDTVTPLAPLRAELDAAHRARARRRRLHPRPGGRGVRARARRVPRRAPRRRRRERHRRDHDRAAGARRRPGRRGRRAVLHLLRERRGDPADRRDARLLRRRPGHDAAPRPRRCAPRSRRARERWSPCDLFGNPAPIPRDRGARRAGASRTRRRRRARALAPGARAGALGTVATFSFFPSKNLGCFGDGGAIATDDDALADAARVLRFHGSRDKVSYERIGWNSRLDELQAAILRVLLPHARRAGPRAAAPPPRTTPTPGSASWSRCRVPTDGAAPAWHLFVVRHERADALAAAPPAARDRRPRLLRRPAAPPAGARAVGPHALALPARTSSRARTSRSR